MTTLWSRRRSPYSQRISANAGGDMTPTFVHAGTNRAS